LKTHTNTETANNYFLPPEWSTQSGVMLTWPHRETIWAETLPAIDQVCVNLAKEITRREKLIITCFNSSHQTHIKTLLFDQGIDLSKVATYLAPSDDIWVRDHGPITVYQNEQPVLLDFVFNGWGNKYPSQNDNDLVRKLHASGAFPHTKIKTIDMILEGGSIEVDGVGTLLTTSACLLANNRNPHLTRDNITKLLQEFLGVNKILWLNHGYLAGDDTDSHIDTLARFIGPNTICYVQCDDKNDEHFDAFKAMEKELQSFKDYQGRPYQLIPLPWPKARYAAFDGRRLPLTYANFLIINEAVLVPTYDDPSDGKALNILTKAFPNREIIGINSLPVIEWYGSLHCMTMQLPEGVLS
jgi:agmatine deiminase